MNQNLNLSTASIRLSLASLRAENSPGLPTRLRIFKFGRNETSQGDFIVDDTTIRNLAAVQRSLGREQVPIGFEHNIDEGSEEYNRTQEPRPIAAKSATVEVGPEKSICLSSINWTPMGVANIDTYEDISPTPIFDQETRRVIGILSASLTRAGATYGLTIDSARLSSLVKLGRDSGSFEDRVISALQDLASKRGVGLTGMARVIAANEQQNAANRTARLSSRHSLSQASRIETGLTGMARFIAAQTLENSRSRQ